MINYFLFPIIGYLLGSIPTAVWLGRLKYGTDIREHGSKNAGATNTFRVLGKKPGIVVLMIDILKGYMATLLPWLLAGSALAPDDVIDIQILTALTCVLGHVFPVYVGFNGGKGVATSLGVIIGLHSGAAGFAVLAFLLVYLSFSYVSLGAIVAAFAFPIFVIFVFQVSSLNLMIFSAILGLAVILAHWKNIFRLLNGTESKMPLLKKKE
ncbi:MAG: glycerol-3-phosphate acyltransferase PlsY [Lentimonas sp.]|jgi:glycerol-3-phosphate acyltransferase PlsY